MKSIIKGRFLLLIFVLSFLSLFGFSSQAQALTMAPDFSVTSFTLSADQNTITFTADGNSGYLYSSCGADVLEPHYEGGPYTYTPYAMSSGTISAGSVSGTISSGEIAKLTNGQTGTPCDDPARSSPTGNVVPGTPGTFTVTNKTLNVSSLANGSYTLSVSLCATAGVCSVATRAFTINNRVTSFNVTATAGTGGSVSSPCSVASGNTSATCSNINALSGYSLTQAVEFTPSNCATGGSFSGNAYTTGNVNVNNCNVKFNFAPVGTVSGYHDGASGTVASTSCNANGWAAFSTLPGTDLTIGIISDGVAVYYGPAGEYRGDLTGQCTSGTCAYNVDLSSRISSGVNHSITVQAQNPNTSAWVTLGGSPKTLNCTAVPPPPCGNGANNPPTCTTCTSPLVWNGSSCVAPSTDACGTYSGITPRLTEPTTNPTACNPGTYANSPADTATLGAQAWNWSCGTVTSCSAPKYGCRVTTDSNYSLPQYGPTGPNNNYGCAGTCANGGTDYSTCTPPVGMSGTLTTPSCTIASGSSTCTTTVSWTVTNPVVVGGSSVTSSYPSAGTVVAPPVSTGTADSGTKTGVTIPYSSRTFYLYNNNVQLNTGTANATCATGSAWNGTICYTAPALPDLTAASTTPSTAVKNEAKTFSSIVTNIGAADTGASFSNFFQVCNVGGGCATPTDLAPTTMTALAGGATGTATKDYTFTSVGTFSVRACADKTNSASLGVINEGTMEGNNCGNWANVTVSDTPTPPSNEAPVITIWATPTSGTVNIVKPTILWSVDNDPTSCAASEDWLGSRNYSGAQTQEPALNQIKTYRYTLICSNAYGSDEATATVAVSGTASGVSISVNPTSIYAGDSATLTWSGAGACTYNFDTGSNIVTPNTTTTYTLTCDGVSSSATLIVKKKPIFIED